MTITANQVLLDFFQRLYEHDTGYVCIATTRPPAKRDTFNEQYFEWPKDKNKMVTYIEKVTSTHNVYFGVNVLSVPRRKKENTIPQNIIWADLDTCHPEVVEIPPQLVIESSPGRFQAIWRLDQKVDPLIAEAYSKRVAYAYADQGADKTGHDLTQLLRVPTTFNFKYALDDTPVVELRADIDATLPIEIFKSLPIPEGHDSEAPDIPMPDLKTLPNHEMIVYRYTENLLVRGEMNAFARYVGEEPPEDWSGHLWRLLLICFRVGMTAEEAFVIAKEAKCNKYERDNRPDSHLWREILKAELDQKTSEQMKVDHRLLAMPALLTEAETETLQPTIIDDYMDWATNATDAVPEFHEISCAMLLSALSATTLRLHTSRNQSVVPNLWAMILGESTLTRKTTAMDMAMDFIMEIDPDLIVASDASMEGLLTELALRPKMVSIFYRDEIAGFFDSMNRKDYLAGMHEFMTKLYDAPKFLKRILKKDTYIVSEPIFMMFGGGTPNRMFSMLYEEHFTSGFIPRFMVMRGHADVANVRPTGPPVKAGLDKRDGLRGTFQAIHSLYTAPQVTITTPAGSIQQPAEYEVQFTDEMWQRLGEMETKLLHTANDSPEADKALPVFSRLYVSLQKLTMILAAVRQEPKDNKIRAEMRDLLCAASYIQKWGTHSVDLIRNSGVSGDEGRMMKVYRTVETQAGIGRGEIMQKHRINARDMDLIETTLVQRMMLNVQTKGRHKTYWPVGK